MTDHFRRSVFSSLGALGAILAATSCCWPVLPFVFAAGTAGGSIWLAKLRPFLLAISALLVIFGFYQAWRAKQCQAKPRLVNTLLLWFSAVVVLVSILFPEALANLLAGSS